MCLRTPFSNVATSASGVWYVGVIGRMIAIMREFCSVFFTALITGCGFETKTEIHFGLTTSCGTLYHVARFEVFTTVKIQFVVFWLIAPCSVVVGYQSFGGPCCLHLHFPSPSPSSFTTDGRSVNQSVCLSVCLSVGQSVSHSVQPSVKPPSLSLSVCQSSRQSVLASSPVRDQMLMCCQTITSFLHFPFTTHLNPEDGVSKVL